MANENIAPIDAPVPTIEVLLAGNIADDDMMWVVRCPATELPRLVRSPVEWVAALARLPGWLYFGTEEPAPMPVLTRDFAVSVQIAGASDPSGRIVVQGISGTNALTVVADAGSAAVVAAALGVPNVPGQGPFQAFWDDVSKDRANPPSMRKRLPVNVATPISRFFAHFEILDPSETPDQRALRTATYLLAAALDPAGHAAMLGGLDQQTLYIGAVSAGASAGGGGTSAHAASPISFAASGAPSLVYANVEGKPGDGDGESNVCSIAIGPVTGGVGTVTGTTVKRYGEGKDGGEPTDPD